MPMLRREALELIACLALPGATRPRRPPLAPPARPRGRKAQVLGVAVAAEGAAAWSRAAALERETYTFVCDEVGRIDPADPSTINHSIVQEG